MISVNYRDARPLYEQIKEGVIKLIMTRTLAQDERLPSVRELAVQLAINPNTIQRAYRELENEGYIYIVSGRGAFVAPQADARADVEPLLAAYKENAAKLIYAGVSTGELHDILNTIEKEVGSDD